MTLNDLIIRVRSYARDISGTIFSKNDIISYTNESIDRIKSIPQLIGMSYLINTDDTPKLLPSEYHYLLAVYSASRCMFQDEQDYRAGTLMNEFETKMDELKSKIDNGEVIIKDEEGNTIESSYAIDYVKDEYFFDTVEDEEIIEE